jgi:histidinol-phosphate aminotransferase
MCASFAAKLELTDVRNLPELDGHQHDGTDIMTTTIKPQSGLAAIRPYVPGKPAEELQRERGLTDIVKLASNENPLGVSPMVLAALRDGLTHLNIYPDPQAYGLRRAIAAQAGVDPEMVRVGNGADGLIRELCISYLEDGDEVLTSCSTFPVYDISAAVMRARLVKTPLRDLCLDLRAMAAAITERTKIIFICNPNNPTSTMVAADELGAFMAEAPDHALVVLDEAYREFVDADDYPDGLAYVTNGQKNVCVLRTFSKSHGIAGIRLGYAFAQPELLAPLRASSESFPVNLLAQIAGEAALQDAEFLRQTVAANRAGREFLGREFNRLGLSFPASQTNFVLVRIGPQAEQVYQKLLERGIIVRPCARYDLPEYLRITVGTEAQNARLIKALEEII